MTRTFDMRRIQRLRGDGDLRLFLCALALIALFGLSTWWGDRDLRALSTLPPGQRVALYQRTLENLQTVCAGPDAGKVEAFCREQAELALRLPECDAACGRLARGHLAQPAR